MSVLPLLFFCATHAYVCESVRARICARECVRVRVPAPRDTHLHGHVAVLPHKGFVHGVPVCPGWPPLGQAAEEAVCQ